MASGDKGSKGSGGKELNSVVTNAQFAFKPGYGTRDAILFYIRYFKNSKGKETIILFDSIQHNKMWYKLMKCGINGKLFNVL